MAQVIINVGSGGVSSFQAAIDSLPKNLVAANQSPVLRGALEEFLISSTLLIDGFTTDASNFITIEAAPGAALYQHANVRTTPLRYTPAQGTAIKSSAGIDCLIKNTANYTVIRGIQLQSESSWANGIWSTGMNVLLDRILMEEFGYTDGYWLKNEGSITVRNCAGIHRRSDALAILNFGDMTMEGSTIHSPPERGAGGQNAILSLYGGAFDFHNNAVFGFPAVGVPGNAVASNNATDCATMDNGGANTLVGLVAADQFEGVTYAARDLRLKTGSALIDAGVTRTNTDSLSGLSRPSGAAFDIGAWESVAVATALSLSGGSPAYVGYPTTLTVTANGVPSGTVTVTPSDGGAGGTFSPTSIDLNASTSSASFTYTPATAGAKSITLDSSLADPAPYTVTAVIKPPSGVVVGTPIPDGQDITINFTTSDNPTSGTVTASPAAVDPGGAVEKTGVVTLDGGTESAVLTGLEPGKYSVAIALTNVGGAGSVTGIPAEFTINSINGEPEGPPGDGEPPAPGTRTLTLNLGLTNGVAASLDNLSVAIHAELSPHLFTAPIFTASGETTDASGNLVCTWESGLEAGTSVHVTVLAANLAHYNGVAVLS